MSSRVRVLPFDQRPSGVEWRDYTWHHGSTLNAVRKIVRGQPGKRRRLFATGWARSHPGLFFSRDTVDAASYADTAPPGPRAVLHVRGIPAQRQELDEDEIGRLGVPPLTPRDEVEGLTQMLERIQEELQVRRLSHRSPSRGEDLALRRLRMAGIRPFFVMRVLGRLPLTVEAVRVDRVENQSWVHVWARWDEEARRGQGLGARRARRGRSRRRRTNL